MKKLTLIAALVAAPVVASAANNQVFIFDDTFSAVMGTSAITDDSPDYEVLWGTFDGSVFSPVGGIAHSGDNDGYLGNPFGFFELSAVLAQANNNSLAVGTQLYLALTSVLDGADYASSQFEAVLTDPSWLTPAFDAFASDGLEFSFTAQTSAVKGLFAYNGGNEIITLGVIPEPSSFAAFAGLVVLGAVATRRRRSA